MYIFLMQNLNTDTDLPALNLNEIDTYIHINNVY